MTNKNTNNGKVYEEAEIVQESRSGKARDFAQSQAHKYAYDTAENMRKQIVFQSLGTIFIFLFGLFVAVALILTILFWLLPFAVAALIVTALIAFFIAGYQSVRNFFGR